VRVRPLNNKELTAGSSAWQWDNKNICLLNQQGRPIPSINFTFDQIFGFDDKSLHIFEEVGKPIVQSALDGINGTIFAYGQTSSGKTHTINGTPQEPGLIPLSVTEIFNYIAKNHDREFLLRVSYMEIYNETITDLLNTKSGKLQMREDINKGIFVAGLSEEFVTSVDDVMALIKEGNSVRHVGGNGVNDESSRSHSIFRMVIESRIRSKNTSSRQSEGGAVRVSLLNLVDLAGSERIKHTRAEGERRKEGAHINKSLLNLSLVISKLSESGTKEHIPFRNSKLTMILQNSLGGNTRTAIICTITPAMIFIEESQSTLVFASRAKKK